MLNIKMMLIDHMMKEINRTRHRGRLCNVVSRKIQKVLAERMNVFGKMEKEHQE